MPILLLFHAVDEAADHQLYSVHFVIQYVRSSCHPVPLFLHASPLKVRTLLCDWSLGRDGQEITQM